ncbi:MAG: CDP-glycerol glycerophosphotransferase family protein [Burkholderiales bacterium]
MYQIRHEAEVLLHIPVEAEGQRGGCDNHLVVDALTEDSALSPEYAGYGSLFRSGQALDDYDLVLTPTHLRDHEIKSRAHVVQLFHGISDKPFTYERDFSDYRLCLCAGQRQLDRLQRHGKNRRMRFSMVGYPKFDCIDARPPLFGNGKKTLIYCPTWRKGGSSSIALFLDNPDVVARLTEDYNLIVKPHPNIFNPAREFFDGAIIERLTQMPGIKLVRSGNVMPWFAQSDLFIGDISASGYEWLYFGRPMVFLNPQPGALFASDDVEAATYLWQCGEVCDQVGYLQRCVTDSLLRDPHAEQREQVLHYSVHQPRAGARPRAGWRQSKRCYARSRPSACNSMAGISMVMPSTPAAIAACISFASLTPHALTSSPNAFHCATRSTVSSRAGGQN